MLATGLISSVKSLHLVGDEGEPKLPATGKTKQNRNSFVHYMKVCSLK